MAKKNKLPPFKEIKIKSVSDKRGSICILNKNTHFFFTIKRIYFFLNRKNNTIRGFHSQKTNHTIFVPISGKFIIKLKNKNNQVKINLNAKNNQALYIKPKIWREIQIKNKSFTCFIINSHFYNSKDYIFKLEDLKNI